MTSRTAKKYDSKNLVRMNRELRLVKLSLMKVTPFAQRKRDQPWIDKLAGEMDLDKLGTPEVSHREGFYYIMDGQHRIEAVKQWNGEGWEDQHIQCWVAEGLTEEEEAEIFLSLNDRKQVQIFQRFRVAINAGRTAETAVNDIVKGEGLSVSDQQVPGAVHAVGALMRIHTNYGPETLRRALRLANSTYGDAGLGATILAGFGLLCHRYGAVPLETNAINSLAAVRGGATGLLGLAEVLKTKTGTSKIQCVAAVAVDVINRVRTGKKRLQPWFKIATASTHSHEVDDSEEVTATRRPRARSKAQALNNEALANDFRIRRV